MIDKALHDDIFRCASRAYEGIATDYLAGFEGTGDEPQGDDAFEPTMWQMEHETDDQAILVILKTYNHPDRKEFIGIVQKAIAGYF